MKKFSLFFAVAAMTLAAAFFAVSCEEEQAGEVLATGVTLSAPTLSLPIGSTETLVATVKPDNASDKTLTWRSNKTEVATVSNDGVVTALTVGAATVTATTAGGIQGLCVVTVIPVEVTGVTLSDLTLDIVAGNTATLTATVAPDNATDKTVTWSSNAESIATVSDAGLVTAVAAGVADITATANADNTKKATCTVTVSAIPVTGVTLNKATTSITIGGNETLVATVAPADATDKTVTWSSNATGIATVDNTGKVTAVAIGAATITVTANADNTKTATCAVTVTSIPPTGVTLNKTTLSMSNGGKEKLTATVLPFPGASQAVTWSSSNTGVATVDATGEVTAVAATGTAVITATVNENTGLTATCAVTVSPSITLTLAGCSGSAVTLTYTDASTDNLTITNSAVRVTPSAKTIKSITIDGGSAILIGRKADSDISLKFNGAALALRDADGNGAIPIGTYAEFQLINTDATTKAGTYTQDANIDLMNEEWTPVGTPQAAPFGGMFDGAGYTIENLYVTNRADLIAKGLFGYGVNATIKNVQLLSGSVTNSECCTGGICGWGRNTTFIGCSNNATINGSNVSSGGICGYSNSIYIACRNSGNITTSNQYAGGIAGYHVDWTGATTTITACYNTGAITATDATSANIGGIAGYVNSAAGITASYNTGEVSMTASTAASKGGIAGNCNNPITGCYWSGSIANAIGAGTGTLTNTQKFSSSAWPSTSIHAEWGVGDGSGSGKYWKNLGSWSGTYPKLFFEQ
jgi:uncharacterized protein YjdB